MTRCLSRGHVDNDLLAQVMHVARDDADNAAAVWEMDNLGGRSAGDPTPLARKVITGIDDGDPAILDALPGPSADGPAEALTQSGADLAGRCPDCADRVNDAYLAEHVQRLHDAVVEHCEYHLNP